MNLQLVYRYNLSLSKYENMFEKKNNKKTRKTKTKRPKEKKNSYRGSRTLGLNV